MGFFLSVLSKGCCPNLAILIPDCFLLFYHLHSNVVADTPLINISRASVVINATHSDRDDAKQEAVGKRVVRHKRPGAGLAHSEAQRVHKPSGEDNRGAASRNTRGVANSHRHSHGQRQAS